MFYYHTVNPRGGCTRQRPKITFSSRVFVVNVLYNFQSSSSLTCIMKFPDQVSTMIDLNTFEDVTAI